MAPQLDLTPKWRRVYEDHDAFWLHDGNPKRPHVRLSGGKHSNGYFNSQKILCDPYLAQKAVEDLLDALKNAGLDIYRITDRVVGPAMGAIPFAFEVARQITQRRYDGESRQGSSMALTSATPKHCLYAYTEKTADPDKMNFFKTSIEEREDVLPVEDVLTTGGSVEKTAQAILENKAKVLRFVGSLVNRSGEQFLNGRKVVSLVNLKLEDWPADDCRLCKVKSEPLFPAKEVHNWAALNAKY